VAVDWHSLCTLLLRSRGASSPQQEADLLRRALRLVRGPVLQDHPATRYTWLVRTPLERTVETVDAETEALIAHLMTTGTATGT
jgi:hypothetical protein